MTFILAWLLIDILILLWWRGFANINNYGVRDE